MFRLTKNDMIASAIGIFFLFSCKTRHSSVNSEAESRPIAAKENSDLFSSAMIVKTTAKGPVPVCSAIPVQLGTTSNQYLLTTRSCVEKDIKFLDTNVPELSVSYIGKGLNLTPQPIETYLMKTEKKVAWDIAKPAPDEEIKVSESNVATQERDRTYPKAFTAIECSDWVAIVRVKSLPKGYVPFFLDIVDMDEQTLNPLRSEPEASKDADQKDQWIFQSLIWTGPANKITSGLVYSDQPVTVDSVSPDFSAFTFKVDKTVNLAGFEIGSAAIGGFRNEKPVNQRFKDPKLYGIFLGSPKFKDSDELKPAFANLATCRKAISEAISKDWISKQ